MPSSTNKQIGVVHTSAVDLWRAAFEALELDLKDKLVDARGDKINVLTQVLREAEHKKQLCLQRRWKVRVGGTQVVLRDVLDKIIYWVNEFKSIGDTVVQFDPVHAALPWAGVRFLLQAAVSDTHCFESTVAGLETISHLIARYAAFEALYTQGELVLLKDLQSRLISLYTQVLLFLAKGVKYFSQSSATRVLKSVFQSSEQKELERISALDEELQKISHVLDAQIQQQVRSDVAAIRAIVETLALPCPRRRLIDAAAVCPMTLEEQKFLRFLKWLSSVPYSHHHARRSEERLPGSTQWLFRNHQYISWTAVSSSSILLIYGIPGCGKSFLASAVVDAFLEDGVRNSLAAPLAYFYCGDANIGRSSVGADEVMRSLTRQLSIIDKAKHEIHEQILLEYERRLAEARLDGFDVPRLRSSECADVILQVLDCNPAVIIVDGIDEVEEGQRHELLEAIVRIRDESASVVKILLSSRDDINLVSALPGALLMRIESTDNYQDLDMFVRHRVSQAIGAKKLLNGNVSKIMQEALVTFLVQRAGEMFLWVNLEMEAICKLKSTLSVQEAMGDSSRVTNETVRALYSKLIQHLHEADPAALDIAMNAFSWLMCMSEPMSSNAFIAAVSSSVSAGCGSLSVQELLGICSNLLVLDSKLNTFRFAHASFREFLDATQQLTIAHVNRVAAIGCLETCINNPPGDIITEPKPEEDFSLYSAMYWPKHYVAARGADSNDEILVTKLKEFVFYDDEEISLPFMAWLDTAQTISDHVPIDHVLKKELNAVNSSKVTPLFTACIYGLNPILHIISRWQNFDVNLRNTLGHTGVYLAAAFGRYETAHVLINLGADITIECGKRENCLYAASFGGHMSIVRLLLEDRYWSSSPEILRSALRVAFLAGQEDVARMLLEQDGVVSDQGQYEYILESASHSGLFDTVQYLQKRYPAYDKAASSNKLINAAISRGQTAFLQKYLDRGLLPKSTIATAAAFSQTQVISLCLDYGMDIEKEGPLGTPLRTASLMGYEPAARTLLERGADINANGSMGDALQAAAMQGHLSIVNLLVQNKANVNQHGGYYGTALQAAAYRGHRKVAEVLLQAGARINETGLCKDAFHAAVEGGQEGVVALFLEKGYHYATEYGGIYARMAPPPLYRNLLREASPTATNYSSSRNSSTSLSTSAELQNMAPVSDFEDALKAVRGVPNTTDCEVHRTYKIQRTRGMAIGQHAEDESYALEYAASKGYARMAKRLLQNRTQLGIKDFHLGQALWSATAGGYADIVEAILSVDMDLRNYIMGSVERAAWHGHLDIMELLLKYEETWGKEDTFNHVGSFSGEYHPNAEFQRYHVSSRNRRVSTENSTLGTSLTFILNKLTRVQWSEIGYQASKPFAIPMILGGCHGDQPSMVERGMQLMTEGDTTELISSIIDEAALSDSVEVLRDLLDNARSLEPSAVPKALLTAAGSGSERALIVLVAYNSKNGVAPKYEKEFEEAVLHGRSNIVQRLLATMGPDTYPQETIGSLFLQAVCKGHLAVLKLLLPLVRVHQDFHDYLDEALNHACGSGHKSIAEYLVSNGANINAVSDKRRARAREESKEEESVQDGGEGLECAAEEEAMKSANWPRTSLQACFQAIPESTRASVPHNDQWRVRQFRGRKQGVVAIQESVIQVLLDRGADVNLIPSHGYQRPPLHSAVAHCSENIVKAMISRGADVNLCTPGYESPLQCAAWREVNSLPIVQTLLDAGAEIPLTVTDEGVTSPVLDAALSAFGWGPNEKRPVRRRRRGMSGSEDGRFIESESVREVMTSGPGAVVELLLEERPELRAKDTRFGLVLQMAAATGDAKFVRLLISRHVDVNCIGHYYGTALQAAARHGQAECVKLLLEGGADVNMVQGTYGTALQAAATGGHLDILRALVDRGADVDLHVKSPSEIWMTHEEESRMPAIQIAMGHKHIDAVKLLLESGARVDPECSILHSTIETGDTDVLRQLLDAGLSPNADAPEKPPALVLAAGLGRLEMVELLICRGADVNKEGALDRWSITKFTPLHEACAKGYVEIVKFLVRNGAEIEKPAQEDSSTSPFADTTKQAQSISTPLAIAAQHGHVDTMIELLSSGARIYDPSRNTNVLAAACQGPEPDASVRFLLERLEGSSEFTTICTEALSSAQHSGKNGAFMLLLKYLPPSLFALQEACKLGSIDAVEYVLAQEVDINGAFEDGGRALHVAAYYGHLDVVSLLLERGSNVNYVSPKFHSPIQAALEGYLARLVVGSHPKADKLEKILPEVLRQPRYDYCSWGDDDTTERTRSDADGIVRILIAAGADANTAAAGFGTPLHLAAYFGDLKMLEVLLDHGADLHASGGFVGSAVIAAVYGDQLETLRLLLNKGADVNLRSRELGTALHCACRGRDRRMIQVLVEAGADLNAEGPNHETPLTALLSRDRRSDRMPIYDLGERVNLLLNQGTHLEVRSEDLRLAATKASFDLEEEVFERLLQYDKSTPVSQSVIADVAASKEYESSKKLEMLLKRAEAVEVTSEMLRSVQMPNTLELLLHHEPRCVVTADLFQVYARTDRSGSDMIQVLLRNDREILPTADAVLAYLQNSNQSYCAGLLETVELMFQRNPGIPISDEMLSSAEEPDVLAFLLKRIPGSHISQTVLESAAKRRNIYGAELLDMLLAHDRSCRASSDLLMACPEPDITTCMEVLLRHDPKLEITEDILLRTLESNSRSWDEDDNRHGVLALLEKYDRKIVISPKVKQAIEDHLQGASEKAVKARWLSLGETKS